MPSRHRIGVLSTTFDISATCRTLAAWLIALALLAPSTLAGGGGSYVRAGDGVETPEATQLDLAVYESEHYDIHTNLRREEARPFARHMDRVFEEYVRRLERFRSADEQRMPLYLFDSKQSYLTYLSSHDIDASNTGGVFFVQRTGQGLATWVRGRPKSEVYSVLQHEGFHQFAFTHMGPRLPIWVNEGLAKYFEDGIFTRGTMRLGLANGERIAALKQAIDRGTLVDFDELLSMTEAQWRDHVVSGSAKAGMLYHQSWSMVHFLIHGRDGKYRRPFESYLEAVAQGDDSADAFAAVFGHNATREFETAWRRYVEQLEPDDLSTTLTRMMFLAQGLKYLHEHDRDMPDNLDDLRSTLQRMRFRSIRMEGELKLEWHAQDDALFAFPLNGDDEPFRLLSSQGGGLPPRLTAPGFRPQPTLFWQHDAEGTLLPTIDFR